MDEDRRGKRWILWIGVSTGPQADEEKDSLPEQERRLREVVERYDGRVVDVIVVPGHSRDYYTYAEFVAGAASDPDPAVRTDAPARMWNHWTRKDFDVFACMDGSRFGREQSIVAEVVGRNYDAKAVIYSHKDGWVERNNRRWFAMMTGYQAAGEIDELKRRRKFGMRKRAEMGLPTSSAVAFPFVLIRDEKGNAVRIEIDEGKRPLWNALHTIIVAERVSYMKWEERLAERGFLDTNGKPYYSTRFYRLMQLPSFWGHSAQYHSGAVRGFSDARHNFPWVYDESESPPDGVILFRHTHPAVYQGDQLDTLIAELERRRTSVRGRAWAHNTHRYGGLLICGSCGRTMGLFTLENGRYAYYRCMAPAPKNTRYKRDCPNRRSVRVSDLDVFFKKFVEDVTQDGSVDRVIEKLFQSQRPTLIDPSVIQTQLDALRQKAHRLVDAQVSAPTSVVNIYEEQIIDVARGIERLENELRQSTQLNSVHALSAPNSITADGLWQRPNAEINQFLHRMMARWRFIVVDGAIEKAAWNPPQSPIHRKTR